MELGVSVSQGTICFRPFILRKSEFLSSSANLSYFDISGEQQSVELAAGELGFTYCQVPVVYSLAKQTSIVVSYADGSEKAITGDAIDAETSLLIFDKTGDVVSIKVALEPGLE
jgi:hypothetical protein